MSSVGDNIRKARIARALTQKQLGDLCGMADSAIRRYEIGKGNPKHETLQRIANALNVTTGYLLGIDDINAKDIIDAMKRGDYRIAEDLMGLPVGALGPVGNEAQEEIEYQLREERHAKELLLNKLRIFFSSKYNKLTDQDYLSIESLIAAFSQLNNEGQAKAVERVEELTEIPKYKKETPQD